jgi:hypothetical protein
MPAGNLDATYHRVLAMEAGHVVDRFLVRGEFDVAIAANGNLIIGTNSETRGSRERDAKLGIIDFRKMRRGRRDSPEQAKRQPNPAGNTHAFDAFEPAI